MNHHTTTPPSTKQPLRRPARSTINLAVVAVLVAVGLTGCGLFRTVLEVHNETDEKLTVISETDTGATFEWGDMPPGARVEIEDECMSADIVVVDVDDEEVARLPGPFCAEASPWVITQDMLPDRSS
ncbi:MAG: hypothetical protein ACFCVC_16205 [Acidimicrobiia bacterium]